MLFKKKSIIIVFTLIILTFSEVVSGSTAMAKSKCNRLFHLDAGDDYGINGSGGDVEIGEKVIDKYFSLHVKSGETVKIIWDSDYDCVNKHSDFEVGIVNKKSGKKISKEIGKFSGETKKIKVSKTGIYYFYFRPKKANCKNGTVTYYFDIAIKKKKLKAVKASNSGKTSTMQQNIRKQKNIKEVDESVNTRRFKIADAPDKVQKWVDKCKSKDIHVLEYKGRYWVYTNLVGADHNFAFGGGVKNRNQIAHIVITPYKEKNGPGYALLSTPKSKKLTIYCKNYSKEV